MSRVWDSQPCQPPGRRSGRRTRIPFLGGRAGTPGASWLSDQGRSLHALQFPRPEGGDCRTGSGGGTGLAPLLCGFGSGPSPLQAWAGEAPLWPRLVAGVPSPPLWEGLCAPVPSGKDTLRGPLVQEPIHGDAWHRPGSWYYFYCYQAPRIPPAPLPPSPPSAPGASSLPLHCLRSPSRGSLAGGQGERLGEHSGLWEGSQGQ